VDTESDHEIDLFLGLSLAVAGYGMYFPIGHLEEDVNIDDEVYECAIDTIKNHRLRVFQNAGYDLMVFEKLGVKLDGPFACTMIMAHMVDENLPSKSLDSLHKVFVPNGVGKIRHPLMQHIIDTMGWRYVPVYLMNEYGTQDAVATSELFMVLAPLFEAQFGEMFSG
jgi:DNA polymerase I-like protein with 3'-5' exonuclease and polymerase domains